MITIGGFSGEIPKVIPRLLPDSAAQVAKNCKLIDGSIMPLRYPADFRQLAVGNIMFYKRGSTWFEWNNIVDVAQSSIAQNRLYVTGDGAPKIVVDSTAYRLALDIPAAALVASVTGTPDPTTQANVAYSYTYVTAFDEESEPSPLSNSVLRSSGMNVTLSGFLTPTSARNYNRIRIYRSQTATSGVTDLYFIKEIFLPVPTPNWIDVVESNPIQESIPSIYYNAPPDDMRGIIELPNGMMAAFSGKKVYFSEPYHFHAWPEKYALTTNYDIVGLGAFGHTLVVMTTGQPYVISGIAPDQMAMEKLDVNYPCVNKRGIVDLGFAVAYPSTDGLVTVSNNGAQLATLNTITREKWLQLSPETIIASQYEGRYIASYSYSDPSGVTNLGTVIIDLTGEQPFISRVDAYYPFMFFEVGAGKLFVMSGRIAQEWDSIISPFMSMTWRSKKFVQSAAINFGCALVDGEALSVGYQGSALPVLNVGDAFFIHESETTGAFGTPPADVAVPFQANVYADGALVRSFTDLSTIARLPGGFLARTWEVEVTGIRMITGIFLAWSPSELAAAGGAQ